MATATDRPTNPTVYVRNLNERTDIPSLVKGLRELFEEFGNVIDVVAKKNLKAKGQAFVVYDKPEAAARAIEEIQGFELFGQEMRLDFARSQSDATVKRNESDEVFEAHKRRRLAEKERKQAIAAKEDQAKLKRSAPGASDLHAARPVKSTKGGLKSTAGAQHAVPDEYLPPNKILFLQNLPDSYDAEGLSALFGRYEGFLEVRMVPTRKGIAFVEYEAEAGAISAKEALATLVLEDQPIRITYQRS